MAGPRDRELRDFLKQYSKETRQVYQNAIDKSSTAIARRIQELGLGASLEEVLDAVYFSLYTNWTTNFTNKQRSVTNRWVSRTYRHFRTDKSIFGVVEKDVQAGVFDVMDLRTIDFYKKSDSFYLSKFITDKDTRDAINQFIQKEFIEGEAPIGKGSSATAKFKKQFEGVLGGEDWKIERVTNTTVNKLRNYASVQYMNQVEVEQFEIVGISDSRQCPYCAELQGYKFSVQIAKETIDNSMSGPVDALGMAAPFITSLYTPSEIRGVGAKTLETQGIGSPPFHPNCRDTIVAVL